jgi:hypothetical protein
VSEPTTKKQHIGSIDVVAHRHGFEVFVHETDNLLGSVTLQDERLPGHSVFLPLEGKLLLAEWLTDIAVAMHDIEEAKPSSPTAKH